MGDLKPTSLTNQLGSYFAAGDPMYANKGAVALFFNNKEIDRIQGLSLNDRLGEYLWLSFDALKYQDEQLVVAASSYASESTRYISLYKIVTGRLHLWQKNIVELSLNDLKGVTFRDGSLMFMTQGVLKHIRICSES